MGTKMITTVSMIFKVRGLEEALKAVRLYFGSRLEGNKFGNRPTIP